MLFSFFLFPSKGNRQSTMSLGMAATPVRHGSSLPAPLRLNIASAPLPCPCPSTSRQLQTCAAAVSVAVAGISRRLLLRQSRSARQQTKNVARGAFDVDTWRSGFCEVEDPEDGYYLIEGVEGIPEDLRGTYFRNGPGKFKVGDITVGHELDGDGMILAISFNDDGQVLVRHRLIQTQGVLRDKQTGELYQPGMYGTKPAGGLTLDPRRLFPKNTANAGVVYWQDRLMALWPYGKPWLIDPAVLGTILGSEDDGTSDLGSVLERETFYGETPKVCGNDGCLSNIGQLPSALGTTVRLVELSPTGWTPRYEVPRMVKIPGYTHLADFAVTKTWLVLARPPLTADSLAATLGKPYTEVLQYDPAGSAELVFATRKKTAPEEITVAVDNLVCVEFANAVESEDGRVVLDMVAADRWDVGKAPENGKPRWEVEDPSSRPRQQLMRYEVDLKSNAWTKKVGPWGGIAKIDADSGDMDTWTAGPQEFLSQPLFVPRKHSEVEDDGYLITVVSNGATKPSEVVVLDAKAVSNGPISRFALNSALPHGTRSCWAEGISYTPEEMKRKMTLLRMFCRKANEWNSTEARFNTIAANPFFQKQGVKMR
eukprot:TRINITY_DN15304_c0_g1_i2.p1 TRINITY_DN15304_c0_g1~~TRINITY_DN15304_c0_g1_i2.p1  ORF type:complete len:597 (+),score=93.37 TRINITY_DN15304_c0_g1_i2:36-1826(+)